MSASVSIFLSGHRGHVLKGLYAGAVSVSDSEDAVEGGASLWATDSSDEEKSFRSSTLSIT